ncbi:MAG: hypothetical protein AAFX58_02285 [Pseudomonadota bacterium]
MNTPARKRLSRPALIRDTAVFQVKLAVDGLIDVVLIPVSLTAAAISFLTGNPLFYQVMRSGRRLERRVNLFGAARRYRFGREDAFDSLARRIEHEIRSEMETHRLQSSAKAALERAMTALNTARASRRGNSEQPDESAATEGRKNG